MATGFDAVGDRLIRTTGLPSPAALTAILFVRLDVETFDYQCAISFDNGGGDYLYLETENDGHTWKLWDDTTGVVATGPVAAIGDEYAFAFTKDAGNNCVLYWKISTAVGAMSSAAGSCSALTLGQIRVGESPFAGEELHGSVSGVLVYSAVLSQAEIEAQVAQIAALRTADLYAALPAVIASTAGSDVSGNGNNFTVGGTLAQTDGPLVPWPAEPAATPTVVWTAPTAAVSAGAAVVPAVTPTIVWTAATATATGGITPSLVYPDGVPEIPNRAFQVLSKTEMTHIPVAPLGNGTTCFVEDSGELFLLNKNSGAAPNGTTILVPIAGNPIAGCAGARWIRIYPP